MQAVQIVGVHGIGQAGSSRRQLTEDWGKALQRGIKEFTGRPGQTPTLHMPHWTPLVIKGTDRLGPEDDPFGESVLMAAEEEEFVADALRDVVRPEDLAFAEEQTLATLGPPKLWSPRITRLAMAYDRRFARGGAQLFVRSMREVRLYLTEPDLATKVRALVREDFTSATSVVIGHSLGSVIAYDLFRHQDVGSARGAHGPAVHTLVTCGSPLGIPSVRRLMGIANGERLGLPDPIRWINVYDPDDFITGGAGLAAAARNLTDVGVKNGIGDPHSAVRYLRTEPVAHAVAGGPR
ncbi:hypothetical protein ACIQU4_07405 [Streptomyces sp. NPDC090741]|uniref:hypothetical protein n=1 Tax=Streptomyces sp. NPDC090741 TaxID=3365967 RepID=UPI003830BFD5